MRSIFVQKNLLPGVSFLLLATVFILGGCASSEIREPASIETPPEKIEKAVTPLVPKMNLSVQTFSVSATALDLRAQATVFNPNSVDVTLESLNFSIRDESGTNYNQSTIAGGAIAPNYTKIFHFSAALPTAVAAEKNLLVSVDAMATVLNTASPVVATTPVDMTYLKYLTVSPKMTLGAKILKLSQNGLSTQFAGQIDININNPNPFKLDVDIIKVSFKNKLNETVAVCYVSGSIVAADSCHSFTGDFVMPMEASNEIPITVYVETMAQIQHTTKMVSGTTELLMPSLVELVSAPRITLETNGVWREIQPKPDLQLTIVATINNENVFPIEIGEIQVNLFKPRDARITGFSWLPTTISGPGSKTVGNWVFIDKLTVGPIGGEATITLNTQYGFKGVKHQIPLSASYVVPLKPQ